MNRFRQPPRRDEPEPETDEDPGPSAGAILVQMIDKLEQIDEHDARRIVAALAAWFDLDEPPNLDENG